MYRRAFLGGLSALLSVALAVPAAAPAAAPAPAPTDHYRALQQLLDAEHTAGMPGVFGKVRHGDDFWQGAAGVADLDTGRPVRPWFRHRVGSITKTFVATTLLQLVGERTVRLDAPIGRYLPGVVPGRLGKQVTVRMLLNHTSGIGNYTDPLFANLEELLKLRYRTVSPRELVATGLAMPATNRPGAAWSYSDTNYIIVGLLIEKVTRRPYAMEVGRRILRPLGLRGTYFPGTDPRIRGPHATACIPGPDAKPYDSTEFNMSVAWAAGEGAGRA